MGRKPKLPPDEMRKRILDAARGICFREGREALSARKLADKIGFSATAIYLHFSGMSDILSVLREEGYRLLGSLMDTVSESGDPLERIVRRVLGLYEFLVNNQGYQRLMFHPEADFSLTPDSREVFRKLKDGLNGDISRIGGSEEGEALINLAIGCALREMIAKELEGSASPSQVNVLKRQLERTLSNLIREKSG
jgi:AcrR family transcriptional regulator